MNQTNNSFEPFVRRFMTGQLSTQEEIELLQWIKQNPENQAQFLLLQEKLSASHTLDLKPQTTNYWLRFLDKINYPVQTKIIRKNSWRLTIPLVAASLVLGLIIGYLSNYFRDEMPFEYSNMQTVVTPYGAKSNFTLPDGTMVWLNSGSKLSFPNKFDSRRTVELDGEAYLQVEKSQIPFDIITSYGTVEVHGTTLNVKAFADDEFETTLVEGSVSVSGPDHSKTVHLVPNQQAFLTCKHNLAVREVDPNLFTSWTEGKLIFVREPFGKVIKQFERWYNLKIELRDEKLKDLWYTGTLEMESFSEVLELISKTTPINYSFDKTSRILQISSK